MGVSYWHNWLTQKPVLFQRASEGIVSCLCIHSMFLLQSNKRCNINRKLRLSNTPALGKERPHSLEGTLSLIPCNGHTLLCALTYTRAAKWTHFLFTSQIPGLSPEPVISEHLLPTAALVHYPLKSSHLPNSLLYTTDAWQTEYWITWQSLLETCCGWSQLCSGCQKHAGSVKTSTLHWICY